MTQQSAERPKGPIRVLVIDDSALVRSLLTRILGADPALQVVGSAPDAFVARERIKLLRPDVLTLDVQMPRMDGLQFLRNLMRLRPMPVVMCSSLTEQGADVTLAALELGAVDFITKPRSDVAHGLTAYAAELIEKIKTAASARVRPLLAPTARAGASPVLPANVLGARTSEQLIAIGASTGGTEAIRQVLAQLPSGTPGIVITQHIPRAFSAQFAARLDACSALSVREAVEGALIVPGHAFVAPGDSHLVVERDGAYYRCRLQGDAPVNRHRPSVDVLFDSVAREVGVHAVGVLLTGMGADGARGLQQIRARGGYTIAQDELSSVVWGMPGAAVALGAAQQVLPLEQIAAVLRTPEDAGGARRLAGG